MFAFAMDVKGDWNMLSENESELFRVIYENDNPKKVAQYMVSLFLGYLHTHGPSQEIPVADPLESA